MFYKLFIHLIIYVFCIAKHCVARGKMVGGAGRNVVGVNLWRVGGEMWGEGGRGRQNDRMPGQGKVDKRSNFLLV